MNYSHLIVALAIPLLSFSWSTRAATNTLESKAQKETQVEDNLWRFAYANCMFWYFKKNNYDLKDIRAISGGIVELGTSGPEKYQQISLFIKDYKSSRKTKNNIDPELLKCFYLDENQELSSLIESLK